ncbi:MAG: hypothetical protein LQ339_002756 [Xanthoria mediterranea]|nr:MAG: hypothetical protein LQ339_002756 [Xanthoria mediterranea]
MASTLKISPVRRFSFPSHTVNNLLTACNPTDAIAPAAMLVIVEPCLAVICVCLPTIAPALQDIASYPTIEYLKMICQIKTAVAPERSPSTERAEIYTPVDRRGGKIYGHRCGVSPDPESQLQEDDEEEEAGQREGSQMSLGQIPEKAVMARGR